MTGLGRDLGLAARSLARSPGLAVVAVLVLGLGLGASTVVYGVADAVLLHPLPYPEPDRVLLLAEGTPGFPEMSVAWPNFEDYRDRARSFSGLAAVRSDTVTLSGGGEPEYLAASMLSAGGLSALGVRPLLGREFVREDERDGAAPVAMLEQAFWQTRYAGDPGIVGRAIVLDGRPTTVVGVAPSSASFQFLEGAGGPPPGVVLPYAALAREMKDRSNHPGIYVLARLAPGVGLAQAREELAEIGRALEEEHPGSNAQVRPVAMPAGARLVRDARGAVLLLLGAVGLVVLVAVLNVAGLLLARGIARRKELAIRAALGAGRAALARQLLAEALVLAGGGGLLGLLLAAWGIEGAAAALRATGLTIPARPELNAGVVVAAVLAALAAGALAGLLPALALSEPRLHDALKETSLGATAGSGGRRARGALVVAEVALAFVLLSGAAMSARGLERLYAQDLGLEPRNVLTLGTASSPARQDGRARLRQRLQDVEDRIRAVPGVEAVSMADSVPFAGQSETTFLVRGAPRPPRGQEPSANVFFVGPEYPKALGIQVLAGRAFRPDDRGQQRVCLVDEALARAFFPGEEALGKWLESGDGQRAWEIVGVLGHVPSYGLAAEPLAPYQLYFPIDQISDKYFPLFTRDVVWAVRTSGPPLSAVAAIRDAVRQADPDQPVHGVRTLEDRMQGSVLRERLAAGLLAGFAAFALALAAVGIYGLVSHGVARRTRELGLRMALGAAPEAVVRMVLAQGMRLAGAGLAIGLAASLALARLMGRLVQGAGVVEPAVFAGLALLLAAVAALASFLPARRAVRIDPGVALREE